MNDTGDLINLLMSELKNLSSGKSTIKKSKAIASVAAQAIYAIRVNIEAERLTFDVAKSSEEVKKEFGKFDFSDIRRIRTKNGE